MVHAKLGWEMCNFVEDIVLILNKIATLISVIPAESGLNQSSLN